MNVFEFQKSFLDRMDEARAVLCWNDTVTPASSVRREWGCFVELQIEPTGWEALWKLPRVICEDLKLRFPTIVFGYVDQVLFKELKAVFVVTAVQDDDVHLPERNEVSLIDLWPTINQENDALNIERTADCIDRLRFFYTHVWMPWDNDQDNDRDWVEGHLESRIRLACDLNNHKLSRELAAHIRTLITEARYLQQRMLHLELDLSDNETEKKEEDEKERDSLEKDEHLGADEPQELSTNDMCLNKSHVTDLMHLHLRMAIIRSEMEILENPEMRRAYNEFKFGEDSHPLQLQLKKSQVETQEQVKGTLCYLIIKPCLLDEQIKVMEIAKIHVKKDCKVQLSPTLTDALNNCQSSDDILVGPGRHTTKFLEYLNNNGSIVGLTKSPMLVEIASSDDDSILFVVDGDFILNNLALDVRNVRTGILLKSGKLTMRNCRIFGNNQSSTQQAIVCGVSTKLVLDHVTIEHVATGISIQKDVEVNCNNLKLQHCTTGLEVLGKNTQLQFGKSSKVIDCKLGMYIAGLDLPQMKDTSAHLKSFEELKRYTSWHGVCDIRDCDRGICILKKQHELLDSQTVEQLMDNMFESYDDKENIY